MVEAGSGLSAWPPSSSRNTRGDQAPATWPVCQTVEQNAVHPLADPGEQGPACQPQGASKHFCHLHPGTEVTKENTGQ